VSRVDARGVALAALRLGAGRARAEDRVDPAVGISGLVKVGERVPVSGLLGVIHASDPVAAGQARSMLAEAITVGPAPCAAPGGLVDEILA